MHLKVNSKLKFSLYSQHWAAASCRSLLVQKNSVRKHYLPRPGPGSTKSGQRNTTFLILSCLLFLKIVLINITYHFSGFIINPETLKEFDDNFNTLAPISMYYGDTSDNPEELSKEIRKYYFGNQSLTTLLFNNITDVCAIWLDVDIFKKYYEQLFWLSTVNNSILFPLRCSVIISFYGRQWKHYANTMASSIFIFLITMVKTVFKNCLWVKTF